MAGVGNIGNFLAILLPTSGEIRTNPSGCSRMVKRFPRFPTQRPREGSDHPGVSDRSCGSSLRRNVTFWVPSGPPGGVRGARLDFSLALETFWSSE
jgi:hypothetical protein